MSESNHTENLRKMGLNYLHESLNFWKRYDEVLKQYATENVNSTDFFRQYLSFIGKEGPGLVNKLTEQNIKNYQFWLSKNTDFMQQMFDSVWDFDPDHSNTPSKQ